MAPLVVHIPRPCLAGQQLLTPTAAGWHCAQCQKTVVDFTQKTDGEILAYFRQNRQGSTCGRFRHEQVNRPLAASSPALTTRRWQVWLSGLLVSALATQSCQTTTDEPTPITYAAPQEITSDSVTAEAMLYPTPISGRVVDQYTQQPVGNVRVQVKGTFSSIITGADGLFAFPEAVTPVQATHQRPYVLQLSADGYPPGELVLDYALPPPNHPLQVVPASLPVPTELMGDVDVLR